MSIKALGLNYFDADSLPLTAVRVRSTAEQPTSHPFDLTEVEHDHDFNELVIVTAGRARQHLEGDEYAITAGDVYILQSQHRHYFYERESLELINIMYDPVHLPLPEDMLRKLPGYCALFLLEPRYREQHRFTSHLHLGPVALARAEELAEGIIREASSNDSGRDAAIFAQFLRLQVYLSRQYLHTNTVGGQSLLRMGKVLGAMEQDPGREWRLHELAQIAGMSRSQFFRVFRQATGLPPIDYLIRLRLQRAMRLLRDSGFSITEIALQCGFSDSNYFSRQFRKHINQSPSAYRKGHQH